MLRLFHAWPTASLAMSVKDGKEALGPGPAVLFRDTAEGRAAMVNLGYRA